MMNKDAIDRIVELGLSARGDLSSVTAQPVIALPSGTQVVDLEKYLHAPVRMRRNFHAERIGEFCDYIKHQVMPGVTVIFIDPNGLDAKAIIDYGSHEAPQWGDHTATLALPLTPEYAALKALCGKDLTQRDLIEYLEDWGNIITPRTDGTDISLASALDAIRKVEISQKASATHTEAHFSAARTAMEEIEARSGAGRLPSDIIVHCPLVHGTAAQSIQARLSLLTGSEKPRFRARIVALDLLKKALADEVEQLIRAEFADVLVFTGTVE